MVLIHFSVRVRHDGIAVSGKSLSRAHHVWGVLLHYADIGVSVKEMYRFRQIRQAGFVHDGGINALRPCCSIERDGSVSRLRFFRALTIIRLLIYRGRDERT